MTRHRSLLPLLALPLAFACNGDNDNGNNPNVDAGDQVPDAAVEEPDAADVGTPLVTAVDYPVIAHGGQLIITGSNLEGTTTVSIGGVAHTNLADVATDSVTVMAVDDTVAVGLTQPIVTTSPLGDSPAFDVTVIHLVISEIDADTPGADNDEFVEIDTGLAEAVSLDGYVLAMFQGNSANGDTLEAIDLAVDTAATGLMLIGPAGLSPQITLAGPNAIEQGEDAAAIYQFPGDVATFAADFSTAGETGLIDAVIWESNNDNVTADFSPMLSDDVVIDEGGTAPEREAVSVQRCLADTTRRLGAAFGLLAPSPGASNGDCAVVRRPRR